MKVLGNLALLLFWLTLGITVGMAIAERTPTPHECVSVCVEQLEKMGC